LIKNANPHYDTLRGILLANDSLDVKKPYDIHDFTIPIVLFTHPRLSHDRTPVSIMACRDGSIRSKCVQICAKSVIVYKDKKIRDMRLTPEERAADEKRRAEFVAHLAAEKAAKKTAAVAKNPAQKKIPTLARKKK